MMKAVVLLSGGIDSAATLFWAIQKGYKCRCLIFDYKQRHKKEIARAKAIAKKAGCNYTVLDISLPWKGSALLSKNLTLPKYNSLHKGNIPSTYVPARNIIFLSYAASYAETLKANYIFIGANQLDYSGYPDCRRSFLKAFEKALAKGTKAGVKKKFIKIIAPFQNKTKARIIKEAVKLGVPLELTWSCYKGAKHPCGMCPSCVIRAKGFRQAGIKDPL